MSIFAQHRYERNLRGPRPGSSIVRASTSRHNRRMGSPPGLAVARQVRGARRTVGHWAFEGRLGVRTSAVVRLEDLGLACEGREFYAPAGWLTLGRILRPWEISTIVFLNNPFRGADFADVIDRVVDSVDRNPRRLRLVYRAPREEALLAGNPRLRRIRASRFVRHPDKRLVMYEVVAAT
jgi:hypothetical protein